MCILWFLLLCVLWQFGNAQNELQPIPNYEFENSSDAKPKSGLVITTNNVVIIPSFEDIKRLTPTKRKSISPPRKESLSPVPPNPINLSPYPPYPYPPKINIPSPVQPTREPGLRPTRTTPNSIIPPIDYSQLFPKIFLPKNGNTDFAPRSDMLPDINIERLIPKIALPRVLPSSYDLPTDMLPNINIEELIPKDIPYDLGTKDTME